MDEEEVNNYDPNQFDDIEDDGELVQIDENDRIEQEKIKSKFHYLSRPSAAHFTDKSQLEMMAIDIDYYHHRCK